MQPFSPLSSELLGKGQISDPMGSGGLSVLVLYWLDVWLAWPSSVARDLEGAHDSNERRWMQHVVGLVSQLLWVMVRCR